MSNEIIFRSMKEYLKKLGKFLFWNFLSAAILGGVFSFMGWLSRLPDPQRKVQGALEHRSVSSELVQTLTREVSLVEISFDILGPGDYTGNYSLRSLVLYKTIQDVVQTFKQETETAFSFI